jgi:hypothetical protein
LCHGTTIMQSGPLDQRLREEQNWIGGRLGNPPDAAFVPPPEDLVAPFASSSRVRPFFSTFAR